MPQLYLLTVLTTILAGMALAKDFLSDRFASLASYMSFMGAGAYRVVLGSLTALIGILNLFLPLPPRSIPVVGDLFPSLAGMAAGAFLIISYVNSNSTGVDDDAVGFSRKVESFSAPYATVFGIITIIVGFLHAIAGQLVLL